MQSQIYQSNFVEEAGRLYINNAEIIMNEIVCPSKQKFLKTTLNLCLHCFIHKLCGKSYSN